MKIDCISDTHGHYPKLEGGDLLIVAGDLTAHDSLEGLTDFIRWAYNQNYRKIVIIGGNHDGLLQKQGISGTLNENSARLEYLQDQYTLFDGLKIWGSPWTKTFPGMNPKCKAFTCDTEEELAEKWAMIPEDIDILVTHSPPYGILDQIRNHALCQLEWVGSKSLGTSLTNKIKRCKLWVFGHIHEGYGQIELMNASDKSKCICVNASHVNEVYEPVNKPIRIVL